MKPIIAPSLLAADFSNLKAACETINNSPAEWLHLDVMDGVFVPNISFGLPVIKALRPICHKKFDVHLMIVEPDKYVKQFAEIGTDILTVHYEACTHLHRTIQNIKDNGMQAGVALNPHTPVSVLHDIIQNLDLVVIMSVNPGFGGQSFIQRTYDKVKELKEIIDRNNAQCLIEIDGGVTDKNANELVKSGANVLVAGSYVFNHENPIGQINQLLA